MLLTGDPGVGKTLALRRFADSLSETRYRPVYTPLSTLRGSDVLRHINQLLALPNRPSKAGLFTQIQREIIDSHEQKGRTVILIIDEGHLLQTPALHELRLLTNFRMDSFDPFILILAGQTDLKRIRSQYIQNLVSSGKGELTTLEQQVIENLREHELLTSHGDEDSHERWSFGDRLSDRIATFGGSWRFLISFGVSRGRWVIANPLVMLSELEGRQ